MSLARLAIWSSPSPAPAAPPQEAAGPQPVTLTYVYNGRPLAAGTVNLDAVIGQLEQDVSLTLQLIQDTSKEARAKVAESIDLAGQIQVASRGLVKLSASARETSDRLVETSSQLEASNIEIDRKVTASDQLLDEARLLTGSVTSQMTDLADVAKKIAAVVDVIRTIARQTNLLALNATIEAARAGPAGRGFSVVATEVKALAGEVQKATTDVAAKIASLEAAVAASSTTMSQMANLIVRFDPVLGSIRSAAAVQIDGTRDVTSKAVATADFADVVAQSAEAMNTLALRATAVTNLAGQASGNMATTLERLSGRSIIYFRRSLNPDNINPNRVPVNIPATLDIGARRHEVAVVELTSSGAMLARRALDIAVGQTAILSLQAIGEVSVAVSSITELGIHLAFARVSDVIADRLQQRIARAVSECQPEVDLMLRASDEVKQAFEQGLTTGKITEDELFSTQYTQIPRTQPVQYAVPALEFYEQVLPPIIERYRRLADDPWFVLAIDRNAYVPVHHPEYSLPPDPDNVVWTDLNCRNRRIMSRAQTLEAARNALPALTATYRREMKDGSATFGKLIATPVFVRGRHWGNAIIGTKIG